MDTYGQPYGLPPALSGHNQYFLWALRGQSPLDLLVVQNHPQRLTAFCQAVTLFAQTSSPDAMRFENGKAIAYCRALKIDLKTYWPRLKMYE